MKDPVLLEAREKVFESYRQLSKEINEISKTMKKTQEKLKDDMEIYNNLSQKHDYLNSLIKIMIEHDCDPVEAKLKYDIELENKTQQQLNSMNTGSAVLTPANTLYNKNPSTRHW